MDSEENAIEENGRLRRTMRDLVTLSTLPAVWTGLGPERIARSLADVLLNTLSLDFIYVRLTARAGEEAVEVVRSKRSAVTHVGSVRAALAPLLNGDQIEPPATIPDPCGDGTMHVAVTRFGVTDDQGILVSGSCDPDFPTEQHRLLLGVGANQTAIVVQRRRAEEQVHEQREWLRVTLASIGDAVIATDIEGRITFLNSVAEELTGWTQADAKGQPLEAVFAILNERTRQPVENPVEKVLREGVVVGLANHTILMSKDGAERPIDDSAAPIRDAAGRMLGVVLIFREVTEQRRAEQQRNVRLAATQALSEAESVEDGASGVLRAVGENLGWDVGFFWTVNDAGTALVCRKSWHRADGPVDEFEKASCSRTFEKSQGLPGRVWASGKPFWILDIAQDGNFPRLASAVRYGLHSAFGCPVVVGDRTLGVIEFFTKRIIERDTSLMELMVTVAGSVGQFIERKTAEDELRRSEQELADFFENATVGLHWVGPDGTILRANRAELDLLGYSREEYVGRPISDFHIDEDVICDILKRLRDGERLIEYPARLKCKDGSIRDVLIDSSVLWKEGKFVHTRCFTRDITERKRAEARVREQEQRTRTILESINDAFCALDRDWNFTYVNRQAEVLLDRRRDDLIGKNHWEEYPATLGTDLERSFRRAISENVTVTLEHFYPPHDRWYEVHAYPSSDGLSVYFQDVSERKRAEGALRESEEKLRLLADTIPQLAWMARPDGYIFWYNRRWYEYTGTTPEQMEGWGWQAVHDPVELPRVLERWKGSIASGEPFDMVFPLKGEDEKFRPFLTRVNPLRDDRGRTLYWFGTNTDISDIKGMEEALRQSEQRFRQLADTMPQIVWTARPDGQIDYLNRRWTEFTGLPQTAGNAGWGSLLHPDDAPAAYERWAASVQSGAPLEMELRLVDRRQQSYRWHLIRTVAVPDGDGRVARWFGTSTDIHEQKRAEESSRFLAEASAELASVVDYESTLQKVANLAVPYFADWSAVDLADDDGNLRRLAVAHQDPDKIALVRALMRDYPPDPNSLVGAFAVLRTGKPEIVGEITDEMLVQGTRDERHLGHIRSLGLKSYICVPLVVSGKTLGLLTFATAESGRKYTEADLALAIDLAHRAAVAVENTQLYQALRETDRRKDEFLATLAHELRNPLAPVRNALQILKMPRVDAETVERSREMMERQVQHLVRLVDDLMDVSRVMRGKIELRREMVELATIVARAVETVQPLVDAEGHELSVRIPSESLLLDADPVRLAQVVGNLLTNATKYTEPGGRIWLTAERDGDMAALRVRDNGIGIAQHMLPRIFELFVQVDHASTKAQGGLGIGLTLVKNLVEMHNGIVQARSEGLGQGSEFIVKLPVMAQALHQDQAPKKGRQTDQHPPPSGKRLLVVDDNQDAANSLAMLLRLQGHEVRVAFSGLAAVEMTKTYTPDVVFMDIGMPGMDGYEAARRIREQPGLGKVVLTALTGWGQQEDRRRTAEAGFDHHLVKPPEPSALESVLDSVKSAKGRRLKKR